MLSTPSPPRAATARERFLRTDHYRAEREWKRLEGTAQRDLFRELRERFLARHARPSSRVLDVGSGPGRFTAGLGDASSRAVALDLSTESLKFLRRKWEGRAGPRPRPALVRGDAVRPPFALGSFGTVAVLGNTLGFAAEDSEALLSAAESMVETGGLLLVEVAPGPGERSRYLARLPPGSVARLLRSPSGAILPRIEREGFRTEPARRSESGSFHRFAGAELSYLLRANGWDVREVLAVAPALGPDSDRLEAVRPDPKAWEHLLRIEEALGRTPERWVEAAAVLIAAVHSPSVHTIK